MTSRGNEWSWHVDLDRRVSWLRLKGDVTAAAILAAKRDLAADARFDPSFGLIVDARRAQQVSFTRAQAQAIVVSSPISAAAPRAIVATTILAAAMAHAYRAVRGEMTGIDSVRVCGTLREARDWVREQVVC